MVNTVILNLLKIVLSDLLNKLFYAHKTIRSIVFIKITIVNFLNVLRYK